MRTRVAAWPLVVAAATVGCAQPGTPPGGEVDRIPPRVVEVVPAAFDTLMDPRARVVIRFDERLSERLEGVRDWNEAVIVSPATSPVRVDAGRRKLEISLARGWEPDRVYRILVRPVFRDLFGNARVEPIQLVFSTGAPIPDAALAGFVRDRLTGTAVPDARVEAAHGTEAARYVAVTDTAGFFAMPFMPAGAYEVQAWQDQNRDRILDPVELQDSASVSLSAGDTAVVQLALLRPDTTPARLARAEPIDSSKVRLIFDDYFPPGSVGAEAILYALPDTTHLARVPLIHGTRLDSLRAVEAEATERDTLPGPDPREGARHQDLRDARAAGRAGRAPLPSQELILFAPSLLRPDSAYYVRVEGATNIHGVEGGGGAAAFVMPSAPEPEPAGADTVPSDTIPREPIPGDAVRPPGGER